MCKANGQDVIDDEIPDGSSPTLVVKDTSFARGGVFAHVVEAKGVMLRSVAALTVIA